MANVKITELTALTDPASTDVLPIVDVVADVTKKISIADLLRNAGSGTAAAPGIAFDGDSNTGIYRPGANQVAVSTDGTARLTVSTSAVTSALPIDVLLGSASTPSFTFTGDLNTGIYSPGADQVAISTNGTQRINIEADGDINIDSGGMFYDATNNRLAIGATDPIGNKLFVNGGNVRINGAPSTDAILEIRGDNTTGTATNAVLSFVSYLSIGKIGSNADITVTNQGQGYGEMVFSNRRGSGSNTEAMRITSTGQLRLAGAGITFNGDTATANELDDYEEGSWTPVVADAESGGNTGTFATNNSWYRKIGNTVFVFAELGNVNTTGLTAGNTFWIRNLPFNIKSGKIFAGWGLSTPLANQTSYGIPFSNANFVTTGYRLTYCTSSGSKTALVSDLTSGTTDIFVGLMYYV